jgi:phage gp37-like protein
VSSPVRQIELAIVQQLREVPRDYKPLIESYAAQLDDEMFGWVRKLPAIWVTFGDVTDVQRKGANTYIHTGTFEVLCAQRHLQENAGRLTGAEKGQDIGVYEMLEHNKLALVNQDLGLDIQEFVPGAIRPLMKSMVNREAVVIYSQVFTTRWMEVYPEPGAVPAGELVKVGLEYFMKPSQTTPPGAADRTDLIDRS